MINVSIAAIALVGDQLGGTQNGDCSQKTARGQLKGCIVPKAFVLMSLYIQWRFIAALEVPNLFQLPRSAPR